MTPIFSIEKCFQDIIAGLRGMEPAIRAINWIFHAIRPLRVPELAVAMSFSTDTLGEDTTDMIVDNVSWDLMRDLDGMLGCSVKVLNNRLFLVHNMFRDYIQKHGDLLISGFHGHITAMCLNYLLRCSGDKWQKPMESKCEESHYFHAAAALFGYAEHHWAEHYRLEQNPDSKSELDQKVIHFLKSRAPALRRLRDELGDDTLLLATQLQLERIVKNILQDNGQPVPLQRLEKAAKIAASAGQWEILKDLLEFKPTALESAFRAAVEHGRVPIINELLSRMNPNGSEPFMLDQKHHDVLLPATFHGHVAVVEILLTVECSLLVADDEKNTAVHIACKMGDANVLHVMSRLRSDDFRIALTKQNTELLCPLQLACLSGSVEAFNLIFKNSPPIQSFKDKQTHPVYLAAKFGHDLILEKIFNNASIDAKDIRHAIFCASQNDHHSVVSLLVRKAEEAAKEAKEKPYDSELINHLDQSLSSAILDRHINVAEVLLEKIPQESRSERTHVIEAVYSGSLEILTMLIKHQMSIDVPGLLELAVRKRYADIVHYLVNSKIKRQFETGRSPIHTAVAMNQLYSLRELLKFANEYEVRKKSWGNKTVLDLAASYGHLDIFKELLLWKGGRAFPEQGRRPPKILHLAMKISDKKKRNSFMGYLLEKEWNPNITDDEQVTPLHFAIENKDQEVLELLLRHDVSPDSLNVSKSTALHVAVKNRAPEMIRILLNHGADPNYVDSASLTPVHIAANMGCNDALRAILGLELKDEGLDKAFIKVNIEKKAPGGWRAIHFAHKHSDLIKTLLEFTPRPDVDATLDNTDATPMILAAASESVESVKLLLKANAKSHLTGQPFGSPIHAAMWKGNLEIVQLLVESQGDGIADITKEPFGTPWHALCSVSKDCNIDFKSLAQKLSETDKNKAINNLDYMGRTPLLLAMAHRSEDDVLLLLDLKADPYATTTDIVRPLHYAAQYCSLKLLTKLLKSNESTTAHNIIIDARHGSNYNVLQHAALGGCKDKFNRLLEEIPAAEQVTYLEKALPEALKVETMDIFNEIMGKKTINPNISDKNGWTGLDIANCYCLEEEAKKLEYIGAIKGSMQHSPTKWCKNDKNIDILVSEDGMDVWMEGIDIFYNFLYMRRKIS
jgi:ankyrin repeat protein